ncbi:MAG: hypothetical protein AMJ69_08310 [Gammaproteobacteria bacterium SG8_47]|jgi:hypothetical protein|nr:MAG: hypothetical protein AMJ69_08310 [Gammaproteobacteria bacterium SG8_47]
MRRFPKSALAFIAAVCLVPVMTSAQQAAHDESPDAGRELELTPELGQMLVQEMQALEDAVMALIPAISSGNWERIAAIGRNIHDSHIMRQALSDAQIEALHQSLPARFQELDHALHHSACQLSQAARKHNIDTVLFYFYKLNEGCVACHSRYARQRFPDLANSRDEEERDRHKRHDPPPPPAH